MTNWYDLTLSNEALDKAGLSEDWVKQWLNSNCTKWAYGRETGDSGYEHLQVRCVSTIELSQMIAIWGRYGHVSRTHAKDFDYVLKDGNYCCSWKLALEKYKNATLYDWQKDAMAMFSLQDERQILLVVDKLGGAGKSYLARYCEANGIAKVIPKMDRAGDMLSAVMVNPASGYIFDIPRSENKSSAALWTAIEQIKNGHIFDWRYQYREMWMESPKIMVFSNYKPEGDFLSKDRWQILEIEKTY